MIKSNDNFQAATQNTNKKKRKLWLIPVAVILLLVIVVAAIPKLLFTDYEGLPMTGSYGVKQVSAILVDQNRVETFEEDASNREVPMYFYYPDIAASDEVQGITNNGADINGFPLVIFSHGAFGYYQSNTSTYMELASHGYVVISLDHPYHSFFTTDTAGNTITVNPEFLQEVMHVNEEGVTEEEVLQLSHNWLDIRVGDMNFVLDSVQKAVETGVMPSEIWYIADAAAKQELADVLKIIDTEKIGLMGHSLGGATSVTVGRTRNDIDAVIDLDGTMLGEELAYENGKYVYYEEAYPVPLLSVDNEEHHLDSSGANGLYVNQVVLENALDSKYTYFVGSGHMNFTDLPLLSPPLASFLGVGEIDPTKCIMNMNEIVLEYFDCYLKGKGKVEIKENY